MKVLTLALAACLVALAFSAGAEAVTCAPPGSSGINQYFETIPGSSCNAAPPGSGSASGSGNPGAHNLSPGETRQLSSQGPAGRAVARLVAGSAPPLRRATAVPRRPAAHAKARHPHTLAPPPPLTASGANPIVGGLRPVVTGSGTGTGLLLPIVLGAVALLALVTLAARLRALHGPPPGEP